MNGLASSEKPGLWGRSTVSFGAVPFLHQGLFWKVFLLVSRKFRAEKVTVLKNPSGDATVRFLYGAVRAATS